MKTQALIVNTLITFLLFVAYHFIFNKHTYSMAYVDSARLMMESNGMKKVKKEIEVKEKTWQSSLDTLAQEIQSEIKKYEKERSSMNDREKKTTEELLGRKQEQFMQYKEASKNKLMGEEQKITNDELAKINTIITEYGKTHHYTIIFGTNTGNIVYATDAINVTDQVLEQLNK